ncbi:MAG: 2-isopropylmalate synthase [Acidiferrobacteraceae bacterium]|nr:2-isopropylmalate synthase [Acidiferrobacteraceae bacterium]|tara:strand:- start:8010 stop:9557 length:1548 start_codon:yes stop_codon:yes gene_type:complete
MQERLVIFDTTLRDGEQSPGASMNSSEKIRIAKQLERMNVDVIEAGFPAASPGDFDAVRSVATEIEDSRVCALARANEKDVLLAAQAIEIARLGRIHTFIATSPIHMKDKLRLTPDEVVERAVAAVALARNHCEDVEFSPEDAGRSELDFLCRVIESVIDAGANTINIPDTVGYTLPLQFGELIAKLREKIPNSDKAVFSVHCHDDLGLAVANSLSAVLNGARQVECTINGLGERAGNASLEEVVMAIRTRQDVFDCDTNLNTKLIVPISRLVSNITGFSVQPNKAVVGANAFAHEAGIHQDGVIKRRETYEIMRAEDVGWETNRMVLGKHSGRNAFRDRLTKLGIALEEDGALDEAFIRFKDLADKKHEIFDDDLRAIITERDTTQLSDTIQFSKISLLAETGRPPTATVTVLFDGIEKTERAIGDGVIDAAFKAVEKVTKTECQLILYSVKNITSGTDAQGEVSVRLQRKGRVVNGQGSDTDIVSASVKAYINAVNRLLDGEFRKHPQVGDAV